MPRVEAGLHRLRRDGSTDEAVSTIVRTTMSDHFGHPNAVCQHVDPRRHELDRYATIASSLVDLTTGSYRLTPGLPCANSYQQAPWNLYDGPGPDDRPDVPAPAREFAGRLMIPPRILISLEEQVPCLTPPPGSGALSPYSP